jgi:hypothetical protein
MKGCIILLLFLFSVIAGSGGNRLVPGKSCIPAVITFQGDTIIVKKDSRLDVLSQKQAAINKRSSMLTSSGQYKGYRIQVLSTNRRDEAFKVKTDLLTGFPDQKSYIIFQSPNFKVRIGNFLKRSEAENFRRQLVKLYPQGGYIVEDAIDYTSKEEEEEVPQ